MDRRKSTELTPEEARRFLEESRTATFASNGRDGYPHLIAMWYAVDGDDVIMTTYGKSQKAINLRRDPRATFMLEAGETYDQLRGLMIRGRAEIIEDVDAVTQVLLKVGAKMSGNASMTSAQNEAVRKQASKRIAIRFHPEKIASWDHRKL